LLKQLKKLCNNINYALALCATGRIFVFKDS